MKLSQLAEDPAPMPSEVTKPGDATKKHTKKGDWRGGNEYYQMKKPSDFKKTSAIEGHKQKKNVKDG